MLRLFCFLLIGLFFTSPTYACQPTPGVGLTSTFLSDYDVFWGVPILTEMEVDYERVPYAETYITIDVVDVLKGEFPDRINVYLSESMCEPDIDIKLGAAKLFIVNTRYDQKYSTGGFAYDGVEPAFIYAYFTSALDINHFELNNYKDYRNTRGCRDNSKADIRGKELCELQETWRNAGYAYVQRQRELNLEYWEDAKINNNFDNEETWLQKLWPFE